jgi:hypothetical protein
VSVPSVLLFPVSFAIKTEKSVTVTRFKVQRSDVTKKKKNGFNHVAPKHADQRGRK